MARKRKILRLRKRKIKLVASVITIAVLALITFGQQLGLSIPNWDEIGETTGLYKSNESVATAVLPDGEMSVHYLDVGKADAIYINCGEFDMLIDAGDDSTGKPVIDYIGDFGIDELDLVIATHPDKDHIGGMANVIETFDIELFWEPEMKPEQKPETNTYGRMESALESKNVKVENPKTGDKYETENVFIEVFSPNGFYSEDNDYSIVVKLTYGTTKFLFTGDTTKKAEKDMLEQNLDLSADVLKVAHHGSKTSSSEDFLLAVNPEISVISVGPDKNNLPSDEVLARFKKLALDYYRTDIYGNIVVTSNGERVAIKTQKSDYADAA